MPRQHRPLIKVLAICLPLSIVICAAYTVAFPTFDVRYRLALDLEVNGNHVENSGVVETTYQDGTDLFVSLGSGDTLGGNFKGNAVTIDLGEKGLIFVIDYPAASPLTCYRPLACSGPLHPFLTNLRNLPFDMLNLPTSSPPSHRSEVIRRLLAHPEPIDVPLNKLPRLVRFRDIDDRTTMEQVDPEHLESKYGPNVRILSATLQLTPDPREALPDKWPKWLLDGHNPVEEASGQGGSIGTYPFKGN